MKLANRCDGSGLRVSLSSGEAERSWVRCPTCTRQLKMRKGYYGRTGRSADGWPETTIPQHNRPDSPERE